MGNAWWSSDSGEMMQLERVYAIVFSKHMRQPMYLVCKDIVEFSRMLQEAMMQYGEIELIYRVY